MDKQYERGGTVDSFSRLYSCGNYGTGCRLHYWLAQQKCAGDPPTGYTQLSAWQYGNKPSGQRSCTYLPDKRFELRRLQEQGGQEWRWVWALYFEEQRVWEVHALSKIRIVQSDAWDMIKEARYGSRDFLQTG